MSRTYQAFRASKRDIVAPCGFEVDDSELSPVLFPFQRALVKWALRKGRCALFCDTGLGKTPMQVDWARIIAEKTGGEVLITAPLNVARQSVRLAKDLGMSTIQYVRSEGTITEPLIITNYELIDRAVRKCSDIENASQLFRTVVKFAASLPPGTNLNELLGAARRYAMKAKGSQ